MNRSWRLWLASASITALALGSAGCSAPQEAGQAGPAECGTGETVTVGILYQVQPTSLDGNYDSVVPFWQISRNLYDGLFKLDNDMKIQPNLATGYEQTDELTYDITLRDDVVFHNGAKFTSADVTFTFDRIAKDTQLASKQKTYISNVESVTAIDDHKVRFKLKQADASFLKILASVVYITPKSVVEEMGDVKYGQNPVGTGPFSFASWTQGDSVVLKANCGYWGDKPIPSQVEFRFFSEPATQISSLQSGEIDIATSITPDLAAGLSTSTDVSVQSVQGNQTFWMVLNTLSGPFADERVRQAMNYAIDKEKITKELLSGYATPQGQPYAESIFGSSSDVDPYPYDPSRAKELLKEAGYSEDKLQLDFVNFTPELAAVQQSIASYLGEAGVKVSTRFDPNFITDTYLAKKLGETQIALVPNTNVMMDADFTLGLHFDGARRGLYFHTPETDSLIVRARGERDPVARQALYDQLNKQLHDIAPATYLYSVDTLFGTNKHIDWKPRPDGAIYLSGISKTR